MDEGMSFLQTITSNYIINVGFTSFFLAQTLKMIFTFIMTREINLERMWGAGGMPSSHSAMTSSIALAVMKKMGATSPEFGIALAFAAIVMYDAMGVRRAAGEQAKVLNKIVIEFSKIPPFFRWSETYDGEKQSPDGGMELEEGQEPPETIEIGKVTFLDKELKEYLGHTPFEVLGGCVLGVLVAILMPQV